MDEYAIAMSIIDSGTPAALGLVLHTLGSTPQKAGAKALFEASGRVHGTLGGGCLEAEARQRALQLLDEGRSGHFTVNLDEVDGWDDGLICGGRATIFTTPVLAANRAAYGLATEAKGQGGSGTLVTAITHPAYPAGTAMWLPEGVGPPAGITLEHLESAASSEKPMLIHDAARLDQASAVFFLEPVCPSPHLVIVGAGHVGKALTHFASRVGFRVTVLDDRPQFANAGNLPDADAIVCGDIESRLREMPLSAGDYVVIVTRGHRHDGAALTACIHRDLAYLGLIGSKRKGLLLRKRLRDEGLASEAEIARIVSPIGFDLGGPTVEEIALSIAAQLVSVRRKGQLEAPALRYTGPSQPEALPIV